MFYAMGIDSWTSESEYNNSLADPTSLWNDNYTSFLYCNPVEGIKFLMKLPPFKEHMLCAPAKASIQAKELIYLQVKSSDWWWHEQVS